MSPRGLFDAWYRWRDRQLARASFHRRAAASPFTRWIVRRRTRELFDITVGFVYSQVLAACVRLDLFQRLANGPRTLQQLAAETELPEEGLAHLLRAAAELRLLQSRGGGRWGLGELGAASLGSPGIAAMVAHHGLLYPDLADPLALLRNRSTASLRNFWDYAATPGTASAPGAAAYSDLMAASQSFIADDVLEAFPLHRSRHLLDIGGGSGVFLGAALRAYDHLEGTLVDLPPVAALARERLESDGLLERATIVAGDMFADPWPAGPDLISLVRVLHDHDDEAVMDLLRAARRALTADGRLLIAEPLAGTRGAGGVGAYFEMYLWAMGSGRPRTRGELTRMLEAAGFGGVREYPSPRPLLVRVLVADCAGPGTV